jgi:hypothetical protein
LEPDLSVAGRGIEVGLLKDLGFQGAGPLHGRVEVIHLEPKENAVSWASRSRVYEVRVIFLVPGMKLQDEGAGA